MSWKKQRLSPDHLPTTENCPITPTTSIKAHPKAFTHKSNERIPLPNPDYDVTDACDIGVGVADAPNLKLDVASPITIRMEENHSGATLQTDPGWTVASSKEASDWLSPRKEDTDPWALAEKSESNDFWEEDTAGCVSGKEVAHLVVGSLVTVNKAASPSNALKANISSQDSNNGMTKKEVCSVQCLASVISDSQQAVSTAVQAKDCDADSAEMECDDDSVKKDCDVVSVREDCDANSAEKDCNADNVKKDCDADSAEMDCDDGSAKNDCDANSAEKDCDADSAKKDFDTDSAKKDCNADSANASPTSQTSADGSEITIGHAQTEHQQNQQSSGASTVVEALRAPVKLDSLCIDEDATGSLRVVEDSDSEQEDGMRKSNEGTAPLKWIPAQKLDPYPLRECLQLTFEEAFFLSYGLGCLVVLDETQAPLDLTELWLLFSARRPRFVYTYVAYHSLRSRGWVPKTGIKYGADFSHVTIDVLTVIYHKGPPFYHGSYSVLVRTATEPDLADDLDPQNPTLNWTTLMGMDRITEAVSKAVLLVLVIRPRDLTESEVTSPNCVRRFKVQETLLKRWVPSKEREDAEVAEWL